MAAVFPFTAIVAQDDMKLAMLTAAVDPAVGGVLVFGDRGSGKSTAVRGLSDLLPPMSVNVGCRYNCDPATPAAFCEECRTRAAAGPLKHHKVPVPVVDLPLGATEDRVVGALDLERGAHAGREGVRAGSPRPRPPRLPLHRRGQSPRRPYRRPAARRSGVGREHRRAGRLERAPSRAAGPGRHRQPRGG